MDAVLQIAASLRCLNAASQTSSSVILGAGAPIAASYRKRISERHTRVNHDRVILSGKGVTKSFGFGSHKTVAVNHVDFSFKEGEVISIVGESGSGKTTLAKMLLGLTNL